MRSIDNPSHLSPEERRHEIAAILASGILRLRARAALTEKSVESDIQGFRKTLPSYALKLPRKPC